MPHRVRLPRFGDYLSPFPFRTTKLTSAFSPTFRTLVRLTTLSQLTKPHWDYDVRSRRGQFESRFASDSPTTPDSLPPLKAFPITLRSRATLLRPTWTYLLRGLNSFILKHHLIAPVSCASRARCCQGIALFSCNGNVNVNVGAASQRTRRNRLRSPLISEATARSRFAQSE